MLSSGYNRSLELFMLYLLIVIFNHKIIIHYLKLLPEKIKILNFESEYKKTAQMLCMCIR